MKMQEDAQLWTEEILRQRGAIRLSQPASNSWRTSLPTIQILYSRCIYDVAKWHRWGLFQLTADIEVRVNEAFDDHVQLFPSQNHKMASFWQPGLVRNKNWGLGLYFNTQFPSSRPWLFILLTYSIYPSPGCWLQYLQRYKSHGTVSSCNQCT